LEVVVEKTGLQSSALPFLLLASCWKSEMIAPSWKERITQTTMENVLPGQMQSVLLIASMALHSISLCDCLPEVRVPER
jgi:hypothetical protein